jgi:hypothetical protein
MVLLDLVTVLGKDVAASNKWKEVDMFYDLNSR